MKTCPNCQKPFEEIAGRLHCPEHGFHALNESGEIVPAEEPSAEELADWQSEIDEQNKPVDAVASLPDPGPVQGPETPAAAEIQRIILSDTVIYYAAVFVGAAVIGLAIFGLYKRGRRAARNG